MSRDNYWNKNITEYQKISEDSRTLLLSVQNTPNTDVLESVQSLLSSKLFAAVCNKENPTGEELEAWTVMLSRLTNTQIKISKARLEFSHIVQAAKDAIIHELAFSLKNHPQMLQEISDIVRRTKISS